ncbi:MAG: hypothetical protein J7474_04745 [Arthrobacter sp.]|nr:hypothetical protein [Arthrobacter sp.]
MPVLEKESHGAAFLAGGVIMVVTAVLALGSRSLRAEELEGSRPVR